EPLGECSLLLGRLGLLGISDRVGDLPLDLLLPACEAAGEGLGVAADLVEVDGEAAEVVLARLQALSALIEIPAPDRVGRRAEGVGVEAAAAVLAQGRVDLQGETAGVVFEPALGVGQGPEGTRVGSQIGGASGLVLLAAGQGVGLLGERDGLARRALQGAGAESGRLLQEVVEAAPDLLLLGLEPVGPRAVGALGGHGGGPVGERPLAGGQVVEAAGGVVALGPLVEPAPEVVESAEEGGEPGVGLAEVGQAACGVGGAAGLVEPRAARLPPGPRPPPRPTGPGAGPRVGVEVARQDPQPVGHVARDGLATGQRPVARLVPAAVAAQGGVGRVAELLDVLAVLGGDLPYGLDLLDESLAVGRPPARP